MTADDAVPDAPPSPEESYLLRLYVAGATPRSAAAIQAVQRLCAVQLPGRYTLEVIDVHQQPALARAERIIATPTLVKHAPSPVQRLVGDFSRDSRILVALGVSIDE
jgi:circadian clock protein KaiB